MKRYTLVALLLFTSIYSYAQFKTTPSTVDITISTNNELVQHKAQLTLKAAFLLANAAIDKAATLKVNITVAILDANGQILFLAKGDGVGVHNTEAARRKAFTAVSTKTATLELSRKARLNPDTQNLSTLPELLLLSGGAPLFYNGNVIGAVGVAGGGSPENDDLIAKAATIEKAGITTK